MKKLWDICLTCDGYLDCDSIAYDKVPDNCPVIVLNKGGNES